MLKIGEFSKLSHLTIKALRFYEKEGILVPTKVDKWTKYRLYETCQLLVANKIRSYRFLGLSIDEIKAIINGADEKTILIEKSKILQNQKEDIDVRLSIINHILEDKEMKYQVSEKIIEECVVYYSETVLKNYSDIMTFIPMCGEKCLELNPGLKCANPPYEFCEYLDGGYKETDIKVRHNEAVEKMGNESDLIKFKVLPATKVLSLFHKGPYEKIGEAYAYLMKYAEENNYTKAGLPRECYIDGIWNKETPEEWLTEIQLPIK